LKDLIELGLWDEKMRNAIIANHGSIQSIESIPDNIKKLYKTVWEISQKVVIDLAADRGAFIDQSQSLNLFIKRPNIAILSSMLFYAWKKGLKTGMYYLRSLPAADPIQITVKLMDKRKRPNLEESDIEENNEKRVKNEIVCTDDVCMSCSG
jgi:ribonucleotide reductase alpha subunit